MLSLKLLVSLAFLRSSTFYNVFNLPTIFYSSVLNAVGDLWTIAARREALSLIGKGVLC